MRALLEPEMPVFITTKGQLTVSGFAFFAGGAMPAQLWAPLEPEMPMLLQLRVN